MTSTVDAPHRVQKENLHAEDGDELKVTFRSSVINRTGLPTRSTAGPAVRAGPHRHQNLIVLESGLRVDKPLERIPSIEESLQLHLVAGIEVTPTSITGPTSGCIFCIRKT